MNEVFSALAFPPIRYNCGPRPVGSEIQSSTIAGPRLHIPQTSEMSLKVIFSCLSVAFGVLSAVLIGIACAGTDTTNGFLGGFTHDTVFAYHPLLMTTGMISCSIMALNSYAILPLSHFVQKVVHVFFHCCALVLFAIGLNCVVLSHNGQNASGKLTANLYSLHSWVGLGALVLYVQNFVLGGTYFAVGVSAEGAKAYLPSHLTLGLSSLALSLAAVVSGISQMKMCLYPVTEVDNNPAEHYANDMSDGCKLLQGGGVCAVVAVVLTLVTLVPVKTKHDEESSDGAPTSMAEKLLKRGNNFGSA